MVTCGFPECPTRNAFQTHQAERLHSSVPKDTEGSWVALAEDPKSRVVVEENNTLFVMTSAFAPNALTTLADADIIDRKPHDISMMPPGRLNALNLDELLDFYAYILSGGNPEDPRFR